jgi:hypothetical protein
MQVFRVTKNEAKLMAIVLAVAIFALSYGMLFILVMLDPMIESIRLHPALAGGGMYQLPFFALIGAISVLSGLVVYLGYRGERYQVTVDEEWVRVLEHGKETQRRSLANYQSCKGSLVPPYRRIYFAGEDMLAIPTLPDWKLMRLKRHLEETKRR